METHFRCHNLNIKCEKSTVELNSLIYQKKNDRIEIDSIPNTCKLLAKKKIAQKEDSRSEEKKK